MAEKDFTHVVRSVIDDPLDQKTPKRYKLRKVDDADDLIQDKVKGRALRLTHPSKLSIPQTNKGIKLSMKTLKQMGIHQEFPSYRMCCEIHQLWLEYLRELAGKNTLLHKLQTTIKQIDIQGAHVEVIYASNPSLVGVKGIIYYDTANTLNLVTAANRKIVIAKKGSMFQIGSVDFHTDVSGSALTRRPHMRVSKVLKNIPFNRIQLSL